MNDKIDGINDRLDEIENIFCNLNLNGLEKSSISDQVLEVEGDWETIIKIEIKIKSFLPIVILVQ